MGVSEAAANFAGYLGAKDPQVFYNAINLPETSYAGPQRPNHLVFIGRMVEGKGWETYLRCLAQLRDAGQQVTGQMLGDGAQLQAARDLAAKLKLDDVVDIPGRVSPAQVRQAIAGATLVNPTVLSEGFQTTLLEAIAEGGRVVTFPVPGAQLLEAQGAPVNITSARTVDSLNKAVTAMLRAPKAPASRELLEQWSWPVRARQYQQIAARVLAN